MKRLLQLIFLAVSGFIISQNISGKVTTEDDVLIPKVLIVNMTTDQKTYTDASRNFIIDGKMGDEIRFAKESFKLGKIIISSNDIQSIKLERIPQEIEEVKIINKNLARSREEELRNSIGLPKGPDKPREKPAEAVNDILMPLIGIPPTINFQAIYDVVSGKSRRLKRLYKYEDMQEGLAWTRSNIDPEYFAQAGIPPEKLNDFLMFSLRDEKVLMYMKAKNVGGITISLDNNIKAYLERIAEK
ncbi:hypothetical protein NG800_010060 [Epilithonimonas ginsengisoli]|uniref:Uncharacterized protein n=1 Tax=Epilithonimonas ginsengisoli TaxID=1245592 RepID=A0ABU4JIA7_9FLAO|nr:MULTISPECIES: hypothetical protein [Chryseobacterium group]MBV6880711.1 hypothetical protein [Epilithonimonas sp. FP105]MDW8549256.1 hypothetical protein [Epilithonimonas ginsengisoli]OAH76321.1 hypothetical protein AXA65_01140 [Chryseobacterium sp. FP211-J200]